MKRGKHVRKEDYAKPKFKKSIFSILFMVVLICALFNHTQGTEANTVQEMSSQDVEDLPESSQESLEEQTVEVSESLEKEESEPTTEVEIVVEPSEDEGIKNIIQNIQTQNNLTESNFSFFYHNIDTNKTYFYNENKYFTAASTVKVPVAMYYYDMINSNQITPDTTLLYASGCYEAGGGTTASTYSVGQKVPLDFLLEQSVVNSDNTAVNILIKNLGYKQCRTDITKYTDETLPDAFYSSNITSAAYAYDVVNYLYEHLDSYTDLVEDMKKSSMGLYLKKYITDYDVAHKYGSYGSYVHDYGIVFGEQTYLIGVFTKGVTAADELIANISLDVLNYTLSGNEE